MAAALNGAEMLGSAIGPLRNASVLRYYRRHGYQRRRAFRPLSADHGRRSVRGRRRRCEGSVSSVLQAPLASPSRGLWCAEGVSPVGGQSPRSEAAQRAPERRNAESGLMPLGVRFDPAIAERICADLADGKSLTVICRAPGMPDRSTVRRWLADPANASFREAYHAARLAWADALFEEIAELAAQARQLAEDAEARGFNAHAAVGALREEVRAKMWVCARLRPDKYGDRVSTEITGKDGKNLIPERAGDPDCIARDPTDDRGAGCPSPPRAHRQRRVVAVAGDRCRKQRRR
jgi:hypothetical protein